MNKKFLVGALLVALSTAGYAYDEVGTDTIILGGSVPSRTDINNNFDAVQNDVNDIKGQIDKINTESGKNWESVQNDLTDLHNNKANKDDVENALAEKVDKENFDKLNNKVTGLDNEIGQITSDVAALQGDINNKVNKDEFEQATDNLQQQIDKNNHISQKTDELLNDKIDKNTSDLNDKINANKAEQADKDAAQDAEIAKGDKINGVQNQQIGNLQTENVEQNNKIEALDKNKVDKNTYEEDKKAQADKDAAQDAEIAKGDRINGVQNQQIGNLQSQNLEQDKNIQANKDAIAANKAEQDKVNAAQKENNEQQQAAIDKNTSDIKDHGNRLDTLENNFAQYDGRLSGLEKKVDHLDDKMNKGLSLMAAMNAVDFQNVQTGEMAIGAGVGHYGNAQSVALGVAYSPVEDLTVNAKYSVTAGDADSFAVGAGATYKFKVGR